MKLTALGVLLFHGVTVLIFFEGCSSTVRAQTSNFQHIVVIVQENRTPDNLFQGLCSPPFGSAASCSTTPGPGQYDIQTADWLDKSSSTGVTQPAPVPLAINYDPSHDHTDFVPMCDLAPSSGGCRMDGASAVGCYPPPNCPAKASFGFVSNSIGILNPYLQMATQFGWANYMFQTNQGPSYPSHQFIFGGTSAPSAADDEAGIFVGGGTASGVAGCTAPLATVVPLIGPGLVDQAVYPCSEHPTLPDLLQSPLTWRYYGPGSGNIWTAPTSISHICQSTGAGGECIGTEWTLNVDPKPQDVLKDIGACNLRSVSWVIPTAPNSDHAGQLQNTGGPSWVSSVVNAIGNSTACDHNTGYWNNTAIFITWDDWGGWYDHEPPTILPGVQGDYQYGFRVPLIVVSAYSPKRGYINNGRHDFGSILRFIEQNFGITEGALNFADARASTNLTSFFRLKESPRAFKTIDAPLTADFFINDTRPPEDPDDDR